MKLYLEGGELTLKMLDAIAAATSDKHAGPLPLARTEAYYARFQTPLSAKNSAAIVWSVLKDTELFRSR